MSAQRQLSIWTALGLWAATLIAAALYGNWRGYGGPAFAIALGVFALFLAGEVLPAAGNLGERIARRVGPRASLLIAVVPLLMWLGYALGTGSFAWWRAGIATAYTIVPVALIVFAGDAKPGAWQDYAAMLAIGGPLALRWLNGLWPYPDAPLTERVAPLLLAINVGVVTFLFVRQLDGVGYTIAWGRDATISVSVNFALIGAIVIPLALWLGFLRFDAHMASLSTLPATALTIFLITAWPEEFFFRGLLQNLLSKTFSNEKYGWIAASVVFGLAHIGRNHVFPNWKYALLGAIAGFFYGRAWRKTNSIFASALVHCLVDTTWHFLFRTL